MELKHFHHRIFYSKIFSFRNKKETWIKVGIIDEPPTMVPGTVNRLVLINLNGANWSAEYISLVFARLGAIIVQTTIAPDPWWITASCRTNTNEISPALQLIPFKLFAYRFLWKLVCPFIYKPIKGKIYVQLKKVSAKSLKGKKEKQIIDTSNYVRNR